MHALTTHRRISPAAWGGGAAGIVALGTLVALAVPGAAPIALVAALLPATAAALADARTGRLPDPLVAGAAVPGVVIATAELVAGRPAALAAIAAGAAWFAVPVLAAHLATPSAMGFGDVKLAAALGTGIGLIEPPAALLALCLAAAITAAFGLATRRRTVSFGPGLVGGASVVALALVLAGREVLPWR